MSRHAVPAAALPPSAAWSTPGAALPARAGIGLKTQHVAELLDTRPALGFLEVHAENYMVAGGPFLAHLERVRERYPLSVHGVGLSLGGEAAPDPAHLARLRALLARFEPESFSEHLAWSSHGGAFFNDLLPLPYDAATLERVCAHVAEVQDTLGRRLLLENPATYVEFERSTLDEAQFLAEVVRRTGCGLLLDVSNAYLSAVNHARDLDAWLEAMPLDAIGEIHLAGFAEDCGATGDRLLIDTHDRAVDAASWALYELVLARTGPVATLIEWDQDVPTLARLCAEARLADERLTRLATAAPGRAA